MRNRVLLTSSVLVLVTLCSYVAMANCGNEGCISEAEPSICIEDLAKGLNPVIHDMNAPEPKKITPGTASTQDKAGTAPSDAIVLFDGTNLSNWTSKGGKAKWKVKDGDAFPVKKSGALSTKKAFGSCQLHVEWTSPTPASGEGQKRGNSGIYLMGKYEVQVLDNFTNKTYPDGQAGALYGRSKPLVNACRKPGEWQSYDIIFHQPTFKDGKVVRKATFTVLHNGVLIQDHTVLHGGTGWMGRHAASPYKVHADKLPIQMQDHGNPVKFRNVWIRELKD
jgi:hypothetical protein